MHHIDWSLWTGWVPFAQLDWSMVPDGPGAYVIATSQPINRAIGVDSEGFLDVGESDYLQARLWSFMKCATKRGTEGHMAGWRYAFFRFERHFPFSTLRVRWRAAKTKAEAYMAEGQVLLAYLQRHCELPPLNYKFNWQVFEEVGWDAFDQIDDVPASTP